MSLFRRRRNDGWLSTTQLGVVGSVVIVTLMVLAYRFDQLPMIRGERVLTAQFAEIGSLRPGDSVMVSGVRIGKIESVELDGTHVDVTFRLDQAEIRLGESTEARIVTLTLLGEPALELNPRGPGDLARGSTIPVERTSSPYDITQALSELTTEASQIDVPQLDQAVDTTVRALDDVPAELGTALEGVIMLSEVVTENDAELSRLLDRAQEVTSVLADRDEEISMLLSAGDSLLEQLNDRRQLVLDVIEDAELLASELIGLIADNHDELAPTLEELNEVLDLLNDNRENLEATLISLASYATTLGEAVNSGPFFDAYVQNLTAPATLAPVLSGLLEEVSR